MQTANTYNIAADSSKSEAPFGSVYIIGVDELNERDACIHLPAMLCSSQLKDS